MEEQELFSKQYAACRYGFVELKYYKTPHEFEEDVTFIDSKALFDALWKEWYDTTLYLTAKEMCITGLPLLLSLHIIVMWLNIRHINA